MRTIHLKIRLPSWIPTRHEIRYSINHIKFKLFPPTCEKCNAKLKTSYCYVGHKIYGNFHNTQVHQLFAMRAGKAWCTSCMKRYIHSLEHEKGECAICKTNNVGVMGYHTSKENNVTITFLWHAWNSGKFCTDCIDELLDNGTPQTDVYQYMFGKYQPVYYR